MKPYKRSMSPGDSNKRMVFLMAEVAASDLKPCGWAVGIFDRLKQGTPFQSVVFASSRGHDHRLAFLSVSAEACEPSRHDL